MLSSVSEKGSQLCAATVSFIYYVGMCKERKYVFSNSAIHIFLRKTPPTADRSSHSAITAPCWTRCQPLAAEVCQHPRSGSDMLLPSLPSQQHFDKPPCVFAHSRWVLTGTQRDVWRGSWIAVATAALPAAPHLRLYYTGAVSGLKYMVMWDTNT